MKIRNLAAVLSLILFAPAAANAAESSWFHTDGAKLRLISLPSADGKKLDAGLQIELESGWKTYWRAPGASGLPPILDFRGSQNIASTKVEYPVPTTFGDDQNLTAGYTRSVTFPISIEPLFANRPITLKLAGLVGICAEVCIPVQFELSLIEDGKGVSQRDIASTLFQARANLAGQSTDNFQIKSVVYRKDRLDVTASLPEGSDDSSLMVEGPESWYLTPARAHKIEDQTAYFEVNLKDIPKQAKPEETVLKFTLVSDGAGVEMSMKPVRP